MPCKCGAICEDGSVKIAKDGIRSIVRIGYDGKVHKTFRGTGADARFANEVKVLKVLEDRGFHSAVMEAVAAATRRSIELGQS